MNYPAKIRYWYYNNISNDVPAILQICFVNDNGSLDWQIPNPPTKATIDAIDNATATAWQTNYDLDIDSDFKDWTIREKAMMKVMRKYVNQLRAAHSQPALSVAEVKADLKAAMQ